MLMGDTVAGEQQTRGAGRRYLREAPLHCEEASTGFLKAAISASHLSLLLTAELTAG